MTKFYKIISITAFCFLTVNNLQAQEKTVYNSNSAESRYKLDFEIKGIPHPDKALLSKIKIDQFDYLRKNKVRVEAKDPSNNLILILYSEEEVAKNKSSFGGKRAVMKTVTDKKYVSTPKNTE